MKTWGGAVVAVVLGIAAGAPAASASTAFIHSSGALAVAANPGETNRVTVFDANGVEVEDLAGVAAGSGCEQMSPTRVKCPSFNPPGIGATLIDLGDGDDFYHETSDLYRDDVNAGTGNDEIYGSREVDVIRGQEGDDKIHGGGGDDQLDGGPGNDTVIGSSDNDKIFGGTGQDVLAGDQDGTNDGSDTISAEDGEPDRVSCDNGTDLVTADQIDTVDQLCEDVRRVGGGPSPAPNPGPAPAALTASVQLPTKLKLSTFLRSGVAFGATFNRPVRFTAVLYVKAATARRLGLGRKDTVIARGSGQAPTGSSRRRLSRRYKVARLRVLARRRGMRIPVVFKGTADDGAGGTRTVSRKLTLVR